MIIHIFNVMIVLIFGSANEFIFIKFSFNELLRYSPIVYLAHQGYRSRPVHPMERSCINQLAIVLVIYGFTLPGLVYNVNCIVFD